MEEKATEILAWNKVPPEARKLLQEAVKVAKNAYAPYSNFWVGAALETASGQIFRGANMENASYGLTICAEVGALQAASSAGALSDVRRIAVVGGRSVTWKKKDSRGRPTMPCGRCRQLISEAANLGGRDIEVWCSDLNLGFVVKTTASQLLPFSFDSTDLSRRRPVQFRIEAEESAQ